jgi:hypothetical protein
MTQFNLSILDYPSKLDMTVSAEMPEETLDEVAQIVADTMAATLTPSSAFAHLVRQIIHLAEYVGCADSLEICNGTAFDGYSVTLDTVTNKITLPAPTLLADALHPLAAVHGFTIEYPNRVI